MSPNTILGWDFISLKIISLGDADEKCMQVTTEEGMRGWRCLCCGKDFGTKSSCRRHVETLHYETPSLGCELCGKTLKNKNSHQNHMIMVHGQKKSGLNLKLDW